MTMAGVDTSTTSISLRIPGQWRSRTAITFSAMACFAA
jgi:hypothetical protein